MHSGKPREQAQLPKQSRLGNVGNLQKKILQTEVSRDKHLTKTLDA